MLYWRHSLVLYWHNQDMCADTNDPGILAYPRISRQQALALADWYVEQDVRDIPPDVVAIGYRWLVWYQPEGYRSLARGDRVFRLHVPGLLFALSRSAAYVFVVLDPMPLTAETQLYVAPFPGLGSNGAIKHWSQAGHQHDLISLRQIVVNTFDACALRSDGHTLGTADGPRCKHPLGVEHLWDDMIRRRWKRFPTKYLVQDKHTLGSLVQRLRTRECI